MDVQRKYGVLRALGWILQVLGVIFFVITLFASIAMLVNSDTGLKVVGVAILPFGIIGSIQLFVIGALVTLMTDLEHNTRATTEAVVHLARETKNLTSDTKSSFGDLSADVRQLSADMRAYTNEVQILASPPPPPPPALSPKPQPQPEPAEDVSSDEVS